MDISRADIDGLWAESLRQGNTISFKVASDSMSPMIKTGDRIRVEPFPQDREPRIGEIVLLRTSDGWLVHRIVGRQGIGESMIFLQKGDAGHHAHPVSRKAIAGRVVTVEKEGTSIVLDSGASRVAAAFVGRFFQAVDWLLNRGGDLGKDPVSGSASAVRVRVSGWLRRMERGVAMLGKKLVRRRR